MSLTILAASDVDQVIHDLDIPLAVKNQADVFAAYSKSLGEASGAMQTPQRISIQSESATSLFMPARVDGQGTAIKIVSVPKSGDQGLPASTLVMDDNGRVRGVVNARKLTALRNACGSALFLQLCPPSTSPSHLVIYGSGAQAQAHASVFARLFPSISHISLAVRSRNGRALELASRLQRDTAVQVDLLATLDNGTRVDLEETIKSADVIITVTSSTEPLFPSHHVSPGCRIILVGSYTPQMREVDDELIKRGGVIVVDSKEACAHEAGELSSAGIEADQMIELGTLVADPSARTQAGKGGDVVIFKSVGLGIQDVAIARLVFDSAVQRSLGTTVPLYDA